MGLASPYCGCSHRKSLNEARQYLMVVGFAAHALELSLRRTPRKDDNSLIAELEHSLQQTLIEARPFLGPES